VNTRQHCFTRAMMYAAAGLVCMAVWRPEMAWVVTILCVVVALANMLAGWMVEA